MWGEQYGAYLSAYDWTVSLALLSVKISLYQAAQNDQIYDNASVAYISDL